ncbi:MAG TPA: DEAD/DEAH box helicase [Candidatus Limnocylindria bacterium]|nr:DEAD/DEAH box helicase [Candidatus Limnocylindria bacterium]
MTLAPERTEPALAGFGALRIHPDIARAIADLGFMAPTPVQDAAIPPLLAGRDVLAQAQTGTGKTAAFAIPIITRVDPELHAPQALVIVPTRELAVQVTREFGALGRYRKTQEVAIYGGVSYTPQERALRRGVQIVVGTPGRLIDHIERGTLDVRAIRIVVLDEADRLLDMGFSQEVRRLLRMVPQREQTALLSATLEGEVDDLARRITRDAVRVAIDPERPTIDTVEQVYIEVLDEDKVHALEELLRRYESEQVLVFRHTKRGVDKLMESLKRRGHSVEALHGDLSQRERERTLEAFKDGRIKVLVATNVAARGLHVEDITHVVNYDLPEDAQTFTHRIGRTGRAGKTGTAITFVGEWDHEEFDRLRTTSGVPFRRENLELYGGR